jgi:hypothetical protein
MRLPRLALGVLFAGPAAALAQPVFQPGPWPQPQPAAPVHQPPPPLVALDSVPLLLGVAVAIYALKKQLEREEEEEVTTHVSDPAAVEYKIMRSNGAFGRPDKFRAMLEEEARAGWELFELLDHSRVRLRRPTACRARDAELTQDPYRARYGSGEAKVVLAVLLGVLIAMALIAVVVAIAMAGR